MRYYAGTCKGICRYSLVYRFLIQLLPLKSSVFVVHFPNAFWQGNEAFPQVSSQNEIVPLLVIYYLPQGKHRGVQMFLLVSLSKSKFFSRVVRVALVSLVSHSCRTRVWHSCCKLDQILRYYPGTNFTRQVIMISLMVFHKIGLHDKSHDFSESAARRCASAKLFLKCFAKAHQKNKPATLPKKIHNRQCFL